MASRRNSDSMKEITAYQWTCSVKDCRCTAVTQANGILSGRARHGGATHPFAVLLDEVLDNEIERAETARLITLRAKIDDEIVKRAA